MKSKTPRVVEKLPANKRVLRRPQVLERVGLRPTALEEAIMRGEFPAAFQITPGGRAVAWLEFEVDQWLEERLRERAEQQQMKTEAR